VGDADESHDYVGSSLAFKAKQVDERSGTWRLREEYEGAANGGGRSIRSSQNDRSVRSSSQQNDKKGEKYSMTNKLRSTSLLLDARSASLMDNDRSDSYNREESYFSVETEDEIKEAKAKSVYPFGGSGYRKPKLSLSELAGNSQVFGAHEASETFNFDEDEGDEGENNLYSTENFTEALSETYHTSKETRPRIRTTNNDNNDNTNNTSHQNENVNVNDDADHNDDDRERPPQSQAHPQSTTAPPSRDSLRKQTSLRSSKYREVAGGAAIKIERQNVALSSALKKPKPVGKRTQSFASTATRPWSNTTGSENRKTLGGIAGDSVQESKATEYRNTERSALCDISERQQQHVERWPSSSMQEVDTEFGDDWGM